MKKKSVSLLPLLENLKMRSGSIRYNLCWITVFGIAIGYLESAVVIYLRELYYPAGFAFPLSLMSGHIGMTEIIRELSTLVILLAIAHLAGSNKKQHLAWFFYCFAIWDLFYYVFLKLLLDWPESLLTWDILFLIPTTWTGPVIAPVIVSVTMIVFALLLLLMDDRLPDKSIGKADAIILFSGAGLLFLSFIWDYSLFMVKHCHISGLFQPNVVNEAIRNYIPVRFNWWLFGAGLLLIYIIFYRLGRDVISNTSKKRM